MSFASIMVHQDLDSSDDRRLEIAIDLARRFEARLIGVAACAVDPPVYGDNFFAGAILNELRPQVEKQLQQAAARFRSKADGNAREVEWRQALERPAIFVARQARAADIIIVGAARGGAFDPFIQLDPGELIMQAGRPVLIVPPEVENLKAAHIVVAWKDSREARRAVIDALPLLKAADDVTVAEIAERDEIQTPKRPGEDVAAWLTSHGVCASGHWVPSGDEPAAVLEGLLLQNAADLIVAGAYSRSRLREWIFGGVTRHLLNEARCCCLLSN